MVAQASRNSSNWIQLTVLASGGIGIVACLVWAMFVVGSPRHARMLELDEERVSDLSELRWAVEAYHDMHDVLPQNLADVVVDEAAMSDPETGMDYGYRRIDEVRFALSATFDLEYERPTRQWNWGVDCSHPAGRHEFTFDLTPTESNGADGITWPES